MIVDKDWQQETLKGKLFSEEIILLQITKRPSNPAENEGRHPIRRR